MWNDRDWVHHVVVPEEGSKYALTQAIYTILEPRTRKIFLPTHSRFYLIVFELHCDRPGFPSVRRECVAQAGFVVRRWALRPVLLEERQQVERDPKRDGSRLGTQVAIGKLRRSNRQFERAMRMAVAGRMPGRAAPLRGEGSLRPRSLRTCRRCRASLPSLRKNWYCRDGKGPQTPGCAAALRAGVAFGNPNRRRTTRKNRRRTRMPPSRPSRGPGRRSTIPSPRQEPTSRSIGTPNAIHRVWEPSSVPAGARSGPNKSLRRRPVHLVRRHPNR